MKTITVTIPVQDVEPGKQLEWVIRNFLCSICEAYLKGAPRRVQAYEVCVDMVESAAQNGDITSDEVNSAMALVQRIENEIYPGCSLL